MKEGGKVMEEVEGGAHEWRGGRRTIEGKENEEGEEKIEENGGYVLSKG